MINIICFDISELGETEYSLLYNKSCDERKSKADRYKDINDKKRCIVAGVLLNFVIRKMNLAYEALYDCGVGNNKTEKSILENFRISKKVSLQCFLQETVYFYETMHFVYSLYTDVYTVYCFINSLCTMLLFRAKIKV